MSAKKKIKIIKQILENTVRFLSKTEILMAAVFGLFVLSNPASGYASVRSDNLKQNTEVYQKTDDLILEKTNNYYNKGMYIQAVDEINIAIENHQPSKDIPDNIQLMGEASYFAWINSFVKSSAVVPLQKYDKAILYLTLHPEVMSTRIDNLVNEMFEKEKIVLENDKFVEIGKNNYNAVKKIGKKINKLEQAKKNLDSVINGNKTVTDIKIEIEVEKEYVKSRIINYLMIGFYCLIFIAIVVLIVFIRKKYNKEILAQTQFETTMKVVAILQRDPDVESPYAPLNTESGEKTKSKTRTGKKSGLSDLESARVALEYFNCEDSKEKFLELQNACMELGERIDRATGRKRNSKKVSELVFKLCKVAGVDDELSLIYYCAGMVYDAGFLSVPRNILQGEHLTIKERYEVRSHVQKAGEYFSFIPEEVRRIFLDAAEFHHENADGRGYLAGLSGTKIPLIARFIRVAESYISLINTRTYKEIMDSESALKELQKKNGIYDSKILALLEKVI